VLERRELGNHLILGIGVPCEDRFYRPDRVTIDGGAILGAPASRCGEAPSRAPFRPSRT
jgi:hypothetical protein